MKTALITGAYRGLGFEAARQLSKRGWQVILTARRKEGAAAAAKLKGASFLELDITKAASVDRAAKTLPRLDVLINNAAIIAEEINQLNPFNKHGDCVNVANRFGAKNQGEALAV